MDWDKIIGSYGFPIFSCIALGVYVWKTQQQNRSDLKEQNETHNKEMMTFKEEMKTALENNTTAITKLTEMIEKSKKE